MNDRDLFRIELGPLNFEHTGKPNHWDRILGIQAELRFVVYGREWFRQPMFPVVEFANAVNSWLGRDGDFEFCTTEAEESPFFWVRAVEDGCVLGAAWQAFEIEKLLPVSLVREVLARFASEVVVSASRQLSIDVSDLVARKAG